MTKKILLGYDDSIKDLVGIGTDDIPMLPLYWNYITCPHVLVIGNTGSGKTYAVKLLLARIGLHLPDAQVTICDFKADDFKFLSGCPRYYSFEACSEGLDGFHTEFLKRQKGEDASRSFKLLMFDEWASYVNNLDKKTAEEERKRLSTLLMLGRSFNIHVLVSQQRADAKYFETARDNFSLVLALGNISAESRDMFFHGFKEQIKPNRYRGTGYLLINGAELKSIQIPSISNMEKLECFIKQTVSR